MSEDGQENKQVKKKLGFIKVMSSVFAAMFGVRSNKYRERDFKHGKAAHFIIAGIIATLLFIFVLYLLVQFALSTS